MNKEISKILIAGTEYDIRDSRFDEASQAETTRQTAETARQEAEQGRVTAEQQRENAEAARAEEFATFEGKIAAKEDAANKVTSIGADANNTTFPTTRAVLNSIAEVKNIEVTPEMLSESTKQYINASGGGTITNLADDEDLTSVGNVLKLADKDYSPTSYSGMGRVYLRKNMVDGKNILTQEMMTKENTIYIIQYDYDLNGATINVPANCTLDFQGGSLGNGTVVFNATELDGNVKIFSGFYGRLTNSQIHTKWFIDLSISTDCTTALRRIIKLAYDSSLNSSGWRKVTKIHIDRGTYNVSSSLIDSSLNVVAGRFNFIGDGYQNTEIVYSSTEVALFDNNQIFGFTTFKDITFKGTNDSVFANLVGGGSGNSQSFTFVGCSFAVWKTILNSSGSTMNSEVTFDRCKIHSCGAAENLCSLFILNNQQAVNWRFISTDIESFIGKCFSVLAGCNVSIYQGSIIPISDDKENPSVFIEVPSNANANSFGSNNSPHFIVNQSRFELRNYTKLLRLLQKHAGLNAVFNEVGLGGSNLASDEDFYTIELIGKKYLTFDNCENFSKYKYIHTGVNAEDTRVVIKTNNGSMFTQLVKYSKQSTQPTNRWAYCFVENTATGEVSTAYSNAIAKGFCLNVNPQEVSYLWSTSAEVNTLAIFQGKEWSTKLMKPMILTGLSVMHFRQTAYGESVINYRVATLDADGNEVKTILQSSVYMTANKVIEAFIDSATPVYGVKLEITHNWTWLTAALVVRGLVKINYI